MTSPAPAFVTRLDGPAVEQQVAADMIRRAIPAAPVLIGLSAAVWGVDGAVSSGLAIGIVLVNFAFAAALLAWSARISIALMMGAALGGYVVRLALITATIFAIRNQPWIEMLPFGLTLIVTHLGLLFWETRYVSASLAFPGLKPNGRIDR